MNRAEIIERSLRAFTAAWLGLIPCLGFPFAAYAVFNAALCHRIAIATPNPASRYVLAAGLLGILGCIQSVVSTVLLALFIRELTSGS